jgi:AcrR family transcriptional regulator
MRIQWAAVSVRAARTAATRARIVAAALEQVKEGGYASASVTAVAARAGVAAGSVYTHFPSKAELFAEVFRGANASELELVSQIAHEDDPVPARLSHAVEAWARRALAAPTLAWALMAEPIDPALEVERSESKRAYRDVFAELLDEGVKRDEVAPLDPRLAAASIVGAMQEALLGPLAEPTMSTEVLVASLIAFVLNAVSAKESPAWPSRRTRRTQLTRS